MQLDAGGWDWTAAAEALLLFGSFFFLLPYIPSNEMDHLPYQPGAACAWMLFAAGRALRWRRKWLMLLIELPLFVLFTWGLHEAIDLLYRS